MTTPRLSALPFVNTSAWRIIMICILGFASGLPLALTSGAMQAWLTIDGVDIATIGFLSLVGLPYTFKFLWAPLMDRFEPPFFGRRRGWLFITQLSIAGTLALMSTLKPAENTEVFALFAVLLAFLSASQDVIVDAYRTDVLKPEERGLGSSLSVFGYRMAMILSGGVALVWADSVNGNGWSWGYIYLIMAGLMIVASFISLILLPSVSTSNVAPSSNAKNDLIGFASVLIAVVIGYQLTSKVAAPFSESLLSPLFEPGVDGAKNPSLKKWADLVSLLFGIGITLPLAWWAAKKAQFETLNRSLANYFSMKGAAGFLAFIILYKLGDAFAGSLTTPFLLKGVGFAQAEIGVVNKVIGIWLTIVGALLGGAIMIRLGLFRALFAFGILQLISNLGFWLVSVSGKGAWGSFMLPAFDILIVTLKEPTNVDWLLLFAVGIENLTGGMGTAAFVAFLMALCNQKFTATQYALLSAFSSVGRVWVGPLSGVLSETIGWPTFFLFSTIMAVPGLMMLWTLRQYVRALETPDINVLAED
jgi:MFS transporter, PAT family, beta-lactamase induction signal transducer AmpG